MVIISDALKKRGCIEIDGKVDFKILDCRRSTVDWNQEEDRVRWIVRDVRRQLWESEDTEAKLVIQNEKDKLDRYLQKICKKLGKL